MNADPLMVILDLDTVAPEDGELERYLIGLLNISDFRLLRYRDKGRPMPSSSLMSTSVPMPPDGW